MPALSTEPFESRMKSMNELFKSAPRVLLPSPTPSTMVRTENHHQVIDVVEQVQCTGMEMLIELLKAVELLGGEGSVWLSSDPIYREADSMCTELD